MAAQYVTALYLEELDGRRNLAGETFRFLVDRADTVAAEAKDSQLGKVPNILRQRASQQVAANIEDFQVDQLGKGFGQLSSEFIGPLVAGAWIVEANFLQFNQVPEGIREDTLHANAFTAWVEHHIGPTVVTFICQGIKFLDLNESILVWVRALHVFELAV